MDQVPCPTNDELRQMAIVAATAPDPRRRLLDELDGACRFAPSRWLIEKELRAIMSMLKAERKAGRVDPQDSGKNDRQLRDEYRVIAERRVRLGFVIAEIGLRNHIYRSLQARSFEDEVVDLIFAFAASGSSDR
jgi:FKBP-type peptidyl-prolyl cis-trans isomerase (trigger factor)